MQPERNYKIEVKICSEAIYSSGEKERNLVQSKVLADRYGLVYFHAKTFKGQLKRQAFWLLEQYKSFDLQRAQTFLHSIVRLFGINNQELEGAASCLQHKQVQETGIMRLSHLELDEQVRTYFIALQAESERDGYYQISPHDLIEAQTQIRTGIQLEEGVVKNKMMTTYHTVKDGLLFHSTLTFDSDPGMYIADLQRIVCSFRRIGAGIHRGRGEVEAHLLVDGRKPDIPKHFDKEGELRVSL